jgi:hypothetical protein
MNYFATLLFFLFTIKINAQSLNGNYCAGDLQEQGFHACFTFGNNQTFWYSDQCADCGWLQGMGAYELSNDTLKLHFTPTCTMEKTALPVRESADSIFYCIKIKGSDSLDLKNSFLFIDIADQDRKIHQHLLPDSMNLFRFGIRKNEMQQLFFRIICFDYNEEWLSLNTLPSSATIYLVKGDNNIPSWETFIYKADFIGRNKLVLIEIKTPFTELNPGKQGKGTYYK